MARNKDFLVKQIKSSLIQSHSLADHFDGATTYQEVADAARMASQAANDLFRLAGMLDVEQTPKTS